MSRIPALTLLATVLVSACGSDGDPESPPTTEAATSAATAPDGTEPATDEASAPAAAEQRFPDVIDAAAERSGDAWTISATLSSPYDTPERYADAWRVVGPDGTVYGERLLAHDHQNEQPFTRSQSGIEIPDDVTEVTIEGRDQQYGWGGATFLLVLDG